MGGNGSTGRLRDGRWVCVEIVQLLRPSLVHAHKVRLLQQGTIGNGNKRKALGFGHGVFIQRSGSLAFLQSGLRRDRS